MKLKVLHQKNKTFLTVLKNQTKLFTLILMVNHFWKKALNYKLLYKMMVNLLFYLIKKKSFYFNKKKFKIRFFDYLIKLSLSLNLSKNFCNKNFLLLVYEFKELGSGLF